MGSICYNLKKEKWEILQEGHLKSNGKHVYIVAVEHAMMTMVVVIWPLPCLKKCMTTERIVVENK